MIGTSPPRSVSVAARWVRRGLSWWLAELAALVPPGLPRSLGGAGAPGVLLEVGPTRAMLTVPGRAGRASLPLPATGDDAARARVRALLRRQGSRSAATVRLDPVMVFRTSLKLPLPAERSLRPIVQHQIGRLVPLDPGEVCFDARVDARSPDGKTVEVELAVVKRASVERAVALARGVGLSPRLVVVPYAGAAGSGRNPALAVWRAGKGEGEAKADRRLRRGLEVVALLLALAAYGVHVHGLGQTRDALRARVAEARRAALAAQELARHVERASGASALLEGRLGAPPPLAVLDELTRLVPEDGWVTQLALRGRAVEMAGYAARATGLIPRIEASAAFEKPRFRSPITPSPDGKGERFDLSFEVKGGAPR